MHPRLLVALLTLWVLQAQTRIAAISGIVHDNVQAPIEGVTVTAHNLDSPYSFTATSGKDGEFKVPGLKPGKYELSAAKSGFDEFKNPLVDLTSGESTHADVVLTPANGPAKIPGFWKRFAAAYHDDWFVVSTDNGPGPKYRGDRAPIDQPPFPFGVWPYGGSPTIGQPDTNLPPLMQALYSGAHGDWGKKSRIKVYGWGNAGFNVSSSNKPGYSNGPAAYYQIPNSVQLDQATLYVERVPDTVQTDHFDWGFRFTQLYGLDYRFTTAKGIFSNQLLGANQKYGYDPVMAYVDLYWPILSGLNIRVGRYISLPDIEAQLAPNNYTYSHSLLYGFDAYTQQGLNATLKLNDHWMIQAGVSAGNDVAPWARGARPTFNTCLGYTWRQGQDNLYLCDNSVNSNRYAYNNLGAYYATYYHKFNSQWHTATESWYMYEKDVPSVVGTLPIETNANGAYCTNGDQSCYAPEFAILNYVERQFGKKNYVTFRNEFFNDMKGQRTGYKTCYTEHMVGWGHWIGSTILLRPELRFEHAYDMAAYDNGTRKSQFVFAGDIIFFY